MQDIAGCRLIVTDISSQEGVIRSLAHVFDGATLSDRRTTPSHGYRAVHVIVNRKDKPVEIQVRTALQHLWAEQSEKISDIVDPAIKYGGGDPAIQETLRESSQLVADIESLELELANEENYWSASESEREPAEDQLNKRKKLEVSLLRSRMSELLRRSIDALGHAEKE